MFYRVMVPINVFLLAQVIWLIRMRRADKRKEIARRKITRAMVSGLRHWTSHFAGTAGEEMNALADALESYVPLE